MSTELLDALAASSALMPVHEIEAIINRGAAAVEATRIALDDARAGQRFSDPLHLIVAAGELRSPELAASLVSFLGESGVDPSCGIAAMEAIARIGEPALPEIVRYLKSHPDPVGRIHAYGALGLMDAPEAVPILGDALETEHEVAGAAGTALARHRPAASLATLYRAYMHAPDHENATLEDAIRTLAGMSDVPSHPFSRDWRTRYRRRPAQNWSIEPGWESHSILAWRLHTSPDAPHIPDPPKRRLEDILDYEDELEPIRVEPGTGEDTPPGYCRRCGRHEEEIAGLRTCPVLARELFDAERAVLVEWQETGQTDIHARLDDLDREQSEGLRRLASLASNEDADDDYNALARRLDRIDAEQRMLVFLVEEGCATASEGIVHLNRLARRVPRASRPDLELHGIVPACPP